MAIAVLDDGRVVSWGSYVTPAHRPPPDMGRASKAVGGLRSIAALMEDGTVRVWGDTLQAAQPPLGLDHVVDVAVAGERFLALRDDGTVVGWGRSRAGEVKAPSGLKDVKAIAVGEGHSLALTTGGQVVAWGDTLLGKCTVPPLAAKAVSIAAGDNHSLAVLEDGSVVGWGKVGGLVFSVLPVPDSARNAAAVYAYGDFSLVQRRDGRIIAWGYNGFHQTEVPADARNLHGIALGSNHVLGFREDGTVIGWGSKYKGLTTGLYWFKEPFGDVRMIKASAGAVFALTEDGKVHGAGYNYQGILDIPSDLGAVASIAVGEAHALASLKDGTVRAWGDSTLGQSRVPSNLRGAISVHAGGRQSAAILRDGSIVRWGDTTVSLATSQGQLDRTRQLSLGYEHMLFLDSSGALRGAGFDRFGELKMPVTFGEIVEVAAGSGISMLREANDTVRIWGRIQEPSKFVPGLRDIAAGGDHAIALAGDGTLFGWGGNYYGQASVPKEVQAPDQVEAGLYFSAALTKSPQAVVATQERTVVRMPLPVGQYHGTLVGIDGRRIWTGRAIWNGRTWDVPASFRGIAYLWVREGKRMRKVQILSVD